ncbi:unnamed protein product [Nippostrongylus brasiliensis]|uniref:Protein Wnt n=1 Tax=Nippostrongylus brasiliensis TaxID=27835 RepID=A0A0N4YV31_NIPBR|nr:unnamed protein product [Nippostrongylus brasiliensis]
MKNSQFKRHTNADLIYMSPSPDFCDPDPARGILGTKGRECNVTSQGVDGCQLRGELKRSPLHTLLVYSIICLAIPAVL